MLNNSTENGVRGEKRTSALLTDDFWVLERYVDSDGADFLVQQKNRGNSTWKLTNLAVIQSKFREDKTTNIEIKKDYISDNTITYQDISLYFASFFVIIHTGDIDHQEIHMVSAQDIHYMWEKDGKEESKISRDLVTLKDGNFNFCIRRILKENNKEDFILRDKTGSYISFGMERIKNTLDLKEISEKGVYLKVKNAKSDFKDFDNDFKDLRDKAVNVGDYILGSLKNSIEMLLVKADIIAESYKGNKGDLVYLEELFNDFKRSFEKWESVDESNTKEKEDFIKQFEKLLNKYHK
ncbi:hypothetical protein COF79_24565 [Bacillus toyonensis]|uniref:hypothetical protein n=1 Tax=Bacillus toyonensis TaxID=155322 RepID=UPI000BFBCCA2|nr:hypothetical protein [Bacillus toyonensis]PHA81008.1 hypothetical protein COE77_29210 [Bacillus toyonensis]PHF22189.1 hypothetical protein COF79_24565 [Bacillus toyonensis]